MTKVSAAFKEFMLILDLALDPRGLARIEKMYKDREKS
jgi:hypothetical protein